MQRPLARISPGSPQDLLVKGHLADLTRSFCNSLPRACPKSFHRSTANTGHNGRDPTRTKRPPKTYKGTWGLSDLLMYFDQFWHAPRKVKVEHVKRHVFARFQSIFRRDLSSIAPEQKVSLEHPKYCACHAQWTPRTRSKNVDSLTKRAFRSSKFTTLNFAPANKNPPAAPLSSTRACSILATCTKKSTCHANENVSCVLRLPHKTPG